MIMSAMWCSGIICEIAVEILNESVLTSGWLLASSVQGIESAAGVSEWQLPF
jgi:hypothetical protein